MYVSVCVCVCIIIIYSSCYLVESIYDGALMGSVCEFFLRNTVPKGRRDVSIVVVCWRNILEYMFTAFIERRQLYMCIMGFEW